MSSSRPTLPLKKGFFSLYVNLVYLKSLEKSFYECTFIARFGRLPLVTLEKHVRMTFGEKRSVGILDYPALLEVSRCWKNLQIQEDEWS